MKNLGDTICYIILNASAHILNPSHVKVMVYSNVKVRSESISNVMEMATTQTVKPGQFGRSKSMQPLRGREIAQMYNGKKLVLVYNISKIEKKV